MQIGSGEAAIRSLEIEGTDHVFGIIGSYILDLFDLVGRSDRLKYVGTRHEEHALHMANAYFRAGGPMGVVMTQIGSGVVNQISGLATAKKAHSPLLAIAGGLPTNEQDMDDRHEVDQLSITRPVTKWAARVSRPDRMAEYVQRAYRIALTPPYGPVFLEVPSDILGDVVEFQEPASPFNYRAKYQAMVSPAAIQEVADLLAAAERPVMILGPGGESREMWDAVTALSEREQIPLASSFGHNSAIPSTAPLALGPLSRQGSKAAMEVLAEADLVLMVGSRVTSTSTNPYYGFKYWPTEAKVVHVDSDPFQVGRYRRIDLGIAADSLAFVSALNEYVGGQPIKDRQAWRERALKAKELWAGERFNVAEPPTQQDGKYLKPAAVYREVGRALGKDGLFVTDVGSVTSWSFRMIDYGQPKGFIYAGAMTGLGFSMPGALGAKLAQPDRPVVSLLGDGAFTLSLPSLITAVEHDIRAQIVIADNQAWGAEKNHQAHFFDHHYVGADLDNDLVKMARGIGAEAVRVSSIEELGHELEKQPEKGPKVIVAPADPEDYPAPVRSKDVIKKPVRLLYTDRDKQRA